MIIFSLEFLTQALHKVNGAVEKKPNITALSCVLVEFKDNIAYFTASDMDMTIRTSLPYTGEPEACSCLIPARKWYDICRSVQHESTMQCTIDPVSSWVRLRAGRSFFTLAVLPVEDFPNRATHIEGFSLQLSGSVWKTMLKKVLFAVADFDIRRYLNGVSLQIQPQCLYVVGMDGHRLACAKLEQAFSFQAQCIVSRKAITEHMRLLEDTSAVELLWDARTIRVTQGLTSIETRTLDATFPAIERALPRQKNSLTIQASTEAMRDAIQRVNVLALDKTTRMSWDVSTNVLCMRAMHASQEEANTEVDIQAGQEAMEKIYFTIAYLADVFKHLEHDTCVLHLDREEKKSLVVTEHIDNVTYTYLVMPYIV